MTTVSTARAGTPSSTPRSRVLVLATLGLAATAWVVSALRMRGMDAGPGAQLGAFDWFAATWLVMMAAMMLPAIVPQAAQLRTPARPTRGPLSLVMFLVGYLAVWLLAGALAYLLLKAASTAAGSLFAWNRAGSWTAAAVLAIAAAYQLTRSKRTSLARCRGPLAAAELARAQQPGRAVSLGVHAGLSCVASSWALMAALFALGAMSLVWMALVSVLVVAERLAPRAARARLLAVPVLLALAVGVALAPAHVPGLTVPGSPAANAAMMRMGATGMRMGMGRPRHTMPMGGARMTEHGAG